MIKERDESIEFINEESPYREKAVEVDRTTMSVPEMRRMLGLGKTDSYWLVHKNCFETILVAGKMRIKLDSFEKWYSMQIKYKKVDGPPPGEALKQLSYSPRDIAQLLDVSEDIVYSIIKRDHLETIKVDYWMRVPVDVFERWYNSQTRYRTKEDRERDAQLEQDTVSMPEIAWMLGIHRKDVYAFINAKENQDDLIPPLAGGQHHALHRAGGAAHHRKRVRRAKRVGCQLLCLTDHGNRMA